MLTATAACVPDALSPSGAIDPTQLQLYLRSLECNNVLLVDGERKVIARLQKAVATQIASYPPKKQKVIEALITALPRLPTVVSQRFVPPVVPDPDGVATTARIARAVATAGCDAIVAFPPASPEVLRSSLSAEAAEVFSVNEYSFSECERQRHAYTQMMSLARRGRDEIARALKSATRFTNNVSLYDRYVGLHMPGLAKDAEEIRKHQEGRERFARSVAFFLQQWRNAVNADAGELTAEVFTAVDKDRFRALLGPVQDEFCVGVRAWQAQVSRLSGVSVAVHVKSSHWVVPHDRYFATDQCTVAVPGGVDVVDLRASGIGDDVAFSDFKNLQVVHGPDVPHELDRFRDAPTAKDKRGQKLQFPPVVVSE